MGCCHGKRCAVRVLSFSSDLREINRFDNLRFFVILIRNLYSQLLQLPGSLLCILGLLITFLLLLIFLISQILLRLLLRHALIKDLGQLIINLLRRLQLIRNFLRSLFLFLNFDMLDFWSLPARPLLLDFIVDLKRVIQIISIQLLRVNILAQLVVLRFRNLLLWCRLLVLAFFGNSCFTIFN